MYPFEYKYRLTTYLLREKKVIILAPSNLYFEFECLSVLFKFGKTLC